MVGDLPFITEDHRTIRSTGSSLIHSEAMDRMLRDKVDAGFVAMLRQHENGCLACAAIAQTLLINSTYLFYPKFVDSVCIAVFLRS
jgi:hypothetical protein